VPLKNCSLKIVGRCYAVSMMGRWCVFSEPKLYRCPNCGKMLASQQSFREHWRRHTGECFICDLCGQKFTTNSGFCKLVYLTYLRP